MENDPESFKEKIFFSKSEHSLIFIQSFEILKIWDDSDNNLREETFPFAHSLFNLFVLQEKKVIIEIPFSMGVWFLRFPLCSNDIIWQYDSDTIHQHS